jgi:enoyl-CoA hydratase
MQDTPLLVSLNDHVLTLTLNRPDRRNALNGELIEALIEAFANAAKSDARAIVLTGSGDRSFCSGADLDPAAAAAGPFVAHEARHRFVDLIGAMRGCGRPIVARVAGPALAGGLGLMVACDMVVAADDVYFATPEVKVGLFPYMIMALILRNVPRKHAMELALTGEKIDAAKAERIGLINRAVPRAELDGAVAELVGRLTALSPLVLALGRDAMNTIDSMPLDEALEYLCTRLTLNTLTEDAAEGITAFVTRRAPEWKGR